METAGYTEVVIEDGPKIDRHVVLKRGSANLIVLKPSGPTQEPFKLITFER